MTVCPEPSTSVASTTMKPFHLIVAATRNGGIGANSDLPWNRLLKRDLKRFQQLTTQPLAMMKQQQPIGSPIANSSVISNSATRRSAIIMGRKTWKSIPSQLRPLKDRLNCILTKNSTEEINAEIKEKQQTTNQSPAAAPISVYNSLENALKSLSVDDSVSDIWLIGGATIYNEALKSNSLRRQIQSIHLTQILTSKFDSIIDTHLHLDEYLSSEYQLTEQSEVMIDSEIPYQFLTYQRKSETNQSNSSSQSTRVTSINSTSSPHEEHQYLNLIRSVLSRGSLKGDRTGTGTLSLFGAQMRFNLRNNVFPLLTTKRVFWKGVVEELLWLIRGSTDSKELSAKKVTIWDGNGSRQFLDKLGFTHRREGDLGPVYGFQWRHCGAKYVDCDTDYSGQGIDQLAQCINTIKSNPNDRRIMLSAWNVADLKQMALPPCHCLVQFYVSAEKELSCHMYQRSCDLGLGVPFNIASYSLLTCMIAHVCNLKRGEFIHTLGDAHVYNNHVEALKEQLQREPRAFPTLEISEKHTAGECEIDGFQFEDFQLNDYKPHATIKMEMAV